MKAEVVSPQFISENYPTVTAETATPWLRSLTYDLAFLAFPWVPFLSALVFGLQWNGGFDAPRDVYNFKLVVTLLFALNFAHRNYTYIVAYGDAAVFRSRSKFFVFFPALVFPAMFLLHSFEDENIDQSVLTVLALWNFWHIIMQRYGLMRGYAHRMRHGSESSRSARLDLSLLWCLVLFTIAAAVILNFSMLESYPSVAQPTVDALAPVFLAYPDAIVIALGGLLACLGGSWILNECRETVSISLRLPRLSFLVSNLSLMALCLVNPVLGIVALGFSHSVEYFAYVHAVQKRKVERRQYRGALSVFFWNRVLPGATLLIGLQVVLYYQSLDELLLSDVMVNTLLSGTGIIHFLYDGMIWKKSKPINTWVI
jgi:hypothetical protein